MKSIVVKDLKKSYGKNQKTKAVKGISFEVEQGEIFGILGPNGAGKSTTIQCMCQLSTITSGTIKINGFDVKKEYIQAKEQIGLSPQELKFDLYFTIQELLIYQAGYFGIPKKEAKTKALNLLKEFGLYEKRKQTVRELSGGMKRKFSIIKALIHDPKIIILDEPTAALDVDTRYELWEFVKKLNKKGITIILTTHYIEEAEKLCNRIAILSKGKIIKLEKTSKLLEDLSRNKITFYLEQESKIPDEIKAKEYKYEDKKLEIIVKGKEQHKELNNLLKVLEKENITVRNFKIEQDNLENIFRRILNEK